MLNYMYKVLCCRSLTINPSPYIFSYNWRWSSGDFRILFFVVCVNIRRLIFVGSGLNCLKNEKLGVKLQLSVILSVSYIIVIVRHIDLDVLRAQ